MDYTLLFKVFIYSMSYMNMSVQEHVPIHTHAVARGGHQVSPSVSTSIDWLAASGINLAISTILGL